MNIDFGNVFILSPHADDVELGMGGTVYRLIKDWHKVVSLLLTWEKYRQDEFHTSMEKLGVKKERRITWGLKDWSIHLEDKATLVWKLDKIINDFEIDTVFLPRPSFHQDHTTTFELGLAATRLSFDVHKKFPRNVFIYDEPTSAWNVDPFDFRFYIQLSEEDVRVKTDALLSHKSQMAKGGIYMNHDYIRSLCKTVGAENNMEFAEKFAVLRLSIPTN